VNQIVLLLLLLKITYVSDTVTQNTAGAFDFTQSIRYRHKNRRKHWIGD